MILSRKTILLPRCQAFSSIISIERFLEEALSFTLSVDKIGSLISNHRDHRDVEYHVGASTSPPFCQCSSLRAQSVQLSLFGRLTSSVLCNARTEDGTAKIGHELLLLMLELILLWLVNRDSLYRLHILSKILRIQTLFIARRAVIIL